MEGPAVSLKTPSSWVSQHRFSLVGSLPPFPSPLPPHSLSVLGLWSKLAFLPRLPIRGLLTLTYNNTACWAPFSHEHIWTQTHGGRRRNPHTDDPHPPNPHHKSPGAAIETGCFFARRSHVNKRRDQQKCGCFCLPECVGDSVSRGVCTSSQIFIGVSACGSSGGDTRCHPECTPCFDWANTLCAGSYVFHLQTDSRTNKHHSLPTHVAVDFVPPVSFYLKACLVTSSSVLDLKTSRWYESPQL